MRRAREIPATLGRWQPRADRRPALYWWPALAIVGLSILLWSVAWPRGRTMAVNSWRMPEPTAAYVFVGTNSQALYLKPDIIARPTWVGFGRAIKDGPDDDGPTIEQRLPPLKFLPGAVSTNFALARLALPQAQPDLANVPVADVLVPKPIGLPEPFSIKLTESLEKAAFTALVSRAALPAAAGNMRAWIELDENGRVSHILGEGEEAAGPEPQALRALRLGGGTNAARGWVELFWEADTAAKPRR